MEQQGLVHCSPYYWVDGRLPLKASAGELDGAARPLRGSAQLVMSRCSLRDGRLETAETLLHLTRREGIKLSRVFALRDELSILMSRGVWE